MGPIIQKFIKSFVTEKITRVTSGVDSLSQAKSYIVPEEKIKDAAEEQTDGCRLEVNGLWIELDVERGAASFQTQPGTNFYGLGQHQKGILSYKNSSVVLKHDNTTIAVPFLITNKGYGILWDNNGAVTADFTGDTRFSFQNHTGGYIDFFVILGDTIDDIIQNYWGLTGEAAMFPKAAFGFWQSKMRYTTQDELIKVAEKYREKNYPVDVIVVDFYHWTQIGDFTFDPECWPDPVGMFERLKELHMDCMVSVWPYICTESKNFEPMSDAGLLTFNDQGQTIKFTIFNGEKSGLYDPFNPKARDYIWQNAKTYYEQGARIWWLDSCEPDDGLNLDDFADGGVNTSDGPLEERINAYALMHCKAFYDGQRRDFENERVLIFARAAFAGCQRYGVTVWSGDVGYDFAAFRKQIAAGLGAAMSGLPFWTTDIGGFQGGNTEDEAYRELYIRWFQYGAFCPIFRVHGSRGATGLDDLLYGISRGENELWSFGGELERIMAKYDNLRYSLLPYIYSSARETLITGTPFMRSLLIDFEEDETARTITDQFMFGKALMVCPVVEAGASTRDVYLPKGYKWFNFWTNEIHQGGRTVNAESGIDTIPVFVKSGSIIPTQPVQQYTSEKSKTQITLNIYPGGDGKFVLYNDDGKTYDYQKGKYSSVNLDWNDEIKELTISDQTDNLDEYYSDFIKMIH